MDEIKTLSYSMIFEVLAALSSRPLSLPDLSRTCKIQQVYLRAVLSSAIANSLIEQRGDLFALTQKGARTAIYIMTVSDHMNYRSNECQSIMHALDMTLGSNARV